MTAAPTIEKISSHCSRCVSRYGAIAVLENGRLNKLYTRKNRALSDYLERLSKYGDPLEALDATIGS